MKLNKKKEYEKIQYFLNNKSINNKSKLIQKIKLTVKNLINFNEIRIQKSFQKLKSAFRLSTILEKFIDILFFELC